MVIDFTPCQGKSYCKEKQEIAAFLKAQFITLYTNKFQFQHDEFGEETLKKYVTQHWLPYDTSTATETFFNIELTELITQDSYHIARENTQVYPNLVQG